MHKLLSGFDPARTSRWKIVLVILSFCAIVFIIYQNCYLDYARRDHIGFMVERNEFPDTWSWFTHAMNFSRTRHAAPGDYFLFRPGLYFFLTVNDIFFRDNLIVAGLFSIFLHLAVTILLYVTFKLYFRNGAPAFLFAALFASQHMGIEMVALRHTCTYMLSVALTLISLLIVSSKLNHRYWLAAVILFAATLFHEVIPASIALMTALIVAFRGVDHGQAKIVTRKVVFIFCATVVLYFIFNAINWKATAPPSFIGPADHFTPSWAFFKEAVRNFFHYLGSGTRTVLCPFSMQLSWDKSLDDWAYFTWDMTEGDIGVYLWWGGVAVALLFTALAVSLRKVFYGQEEPSDIITLWACCGLLSLTVIYSFGRLTIRNPGYSVTSTYYYWFFSFFYMIVIKFLLDEVLKKVSTFWWKRGACVVGYSLMTVMIVGQICMAKNAINNNYDLAWAKQITDAVRTSKVYFAEHPDACLDATETYLNVPPRNLQYFTLPYYLNKYNCGRAAGTSVVHLQRTTDGGTRIQPGPYPDHFEPVN